MVDSCCSGGQAFPRSPAYPLAGRDTMTPGDVACTNTEPASFLPLTTQIVGSYCKPHWLARHDRMGSYDGSWWRPEASVLRDAREDAALLSILEQERAGLDIVTDGEAQRAAYDRHFLSGLSGIDTDQLVRQRPTDEVTTRTRRIEGVEERTELSHRRPSVTGEIWFRSPVAVDELRFLRAHARRPVKIAVPGPLTLASRVADAFYRNEEALILALAAALNEELLSLQQAGADVLQVDEPAFHTHLSQAYRFGVAAVERTIQGISVPTIIHCCYGYAYAFAEKRVNPAYAEVLELLAATSATAISLEYEQPGHGPDLLRHCGDKHIVLGLLNLGTQEIETPEHVASRLRGALEVVPPERLHPCADCGMWFLPRSVAFGKISALVSGTNLERRRLDLERPGLHSAVWGQCSWGR